MSSELTAKVLVLGDQSVGKSSLVHLLTEHRVLAAPRWTVGCSVDALLFGSTGHFISLWDVGGAPRFERSRSLFFADADAVLLVHDLSNRRSYTNLRRWLRELTAYFNPAAVADGASAAAQWASNAAQSEFGDATGNDLVHVMDLDIGNGLSLPVLVLGNKLDEVLDDAARLDVEGGTADSVHVSAHDVRAFAPGSVGGTAITRLLERALTRARARVASTASVSAAGFHQPSSSTVFGDARRPSVHRTNASGATSFASPLAGAMPSLHHHSQLDSNDNVFDDRSRIDSPITVTSGGGGSGRRKADKKD